MVKSTNKPGAPEVGFVVDAGPGIGYGYVVRCHRLARALGDDSRITFYPLSTPCRGFLEAHGWNLGSAVSAAGGARHFMLDTRGDVPDREVSFDTKALRVHIEELRTIGSILGERDKFATETESQNKTASRRALYAKRPIAPGETISNDMLYALRPAVGISPEFVDDVVGRQARNSIDENEPAQWDSIG